MTYVLDTNVFSVLFRNVYHNIFRSFWDNFDRLVADDRITSTREVMRELKDWNVVEARNWATRHCNLFPPPSATEAKFVSNIFAEPKFWENIGEKKLLKGSKNADPFVIARAFILGATVVTQEKSASGAKIPDICNHFEIDWVTLEGFMEREDWSF